MKVLGLWPTLHIHPFSCVWKPWRNPCICFSNNTWTTMLWPVFITKDPRSSLCQETSPSLLFWLLASLLYRLFPLLGLDWSFHRYVPPLHHKKLKFHPVFLLQYQPFEAPKKKEKIILVKTRAVVSYIFYTVINEIHQGWKLDTVEFHF